MQPRLERLEMEKFLLAQLIPLFESEPATGTKQLFKRKELKA
jgi:hypothetical protein